MSWHLLGAEGTDTCTHVDACGLGTILAGVEGRKLVFVTADSFPPEQVFNVIRQYAQDCPVDVATDPTVMQGGDYM